MPQSEGQKEQDEFSRAVAWAHENINNTDPETQAHVQGLLQQYGQKSPLRKAAAFGVGAAEAFNPLSVPHDLATTLGAARIMQKQEGFGKTPSGLYGPTPPENPIPFSQAKSMAEKTTMIPDLSIQRGISELPGGKEFVQTLPENYQNYGGIAGSLLGMGLGAKGILQGSKLKQAETAVQDVTKNVKYLTGIGEGDVLDSIIKRPEQVRNLLNSGNLKAGDVGLEIAKQLEGNKEAIGTTIGLFRDAAKADTKPSINIKKVLDTFSTVESQAMSGQGTSALSPSSVKMMDQVKSLIPTKGGKISPSDALLITDKIDQMNLFNKANPGNIDGSVIKALQDVRANLKDAARASTGIGKQWALADDSYHNFLTSSEGLIDKFSGDQRESFTNSLLNNAKDPLRQRLTQALDIINEGKTPKPSDLFFNQLADLKGAQALKAVDITSQDKAADQVNRIFNKWVKRGENIGEAVGAGVGGIAGALTPGLPNIGGVAETVGGSYLGGKFGKTIGGLGGEIIGKMKGSPEAILKSAEKAKILSQQAKDLASDLGFFQKKFGTEGANIFWNMVQSSVPAAHELSTYMNGRLNASR